MTTCLDLFTASGLRGIELQQAVDSAFPDGDCEAVAVSPHSPGPVQDSETLTRLIFTPIHIHPETGEPISMAFADAWHSDLSVFREENATDPEIALSISQRKQTGLKKSPPQDREVVGAMAATAWMVRNTLIAADGPRVFRVYDTAEERKPNHASVFLTGAARINLTEKKIRKRLFELFSPLMNYRLDRLTLPASSKLQT